MIRLLSDKALHHVILHVDLRDFSAHTFGQLQRSAYHPNEVSSVRIP